MYLFDYWSVETILFYIINQMQLNSLFRTKKLREIDSAYRNSVS